MAFNGTKDRCGTTFPRNILDKETCKYNNSIFFFILWSDLFLSYLRENFIILGLHLFLERIPSEESKREETPIFFQQYISCFISSSNSCPICFFPKFSHNNQNLTMICMRVMVVECSENWHFLIQFQRQIILNKNNKNQTSGLESAPQKYTDYSKVLD